MVLYFCVRFRACGDAIPRLGALVTSLSNSQNFPYHLKKAGGGAGEAAKKLKGNFGVAFALPYLRNLFTTPLKRLGVCSELSSVWWQPEALAYTEQVVVPETLTPHHFALAAHFVCVACSVVGCSLSGLVRAYGLRVRASREQKKKRRTKRRSVVWPACRPNYSFPINTSQDTQSSPYFLSGLLGKRLSSL